MSETKRTEIRQQPYYGGTLALVTDDDDPETLLLEWAGYEGGGATICLDVESEVPRLRAALDEHLGLRHDGMVTVWHRDGTYAGCMGVERWERLLADDEAQRLPLKMLEPGDRPLCRCGHPEHPGLNCHSCVCATSEPSGRARGSDGRVFRIGEGRILGGAA